MLKNLMIDKELHSRLKRLISLMQAEDPEKKITIQGFVEEAIDTAIQAEYRSLEVKTKIQHGFRSEEIKF